ncbi:uncharacterized protein EI97DRAFT_25396 [Westerdykella ornata]|uniref:Uncharacterized protein n=1 Tax=Westerdykella ornata TaxID=318751 RepID=A0A6A6JXZ6_WESOR|nr:uncharacterized protein EI97DRAFT_25396 [Westerdykella ornata]KAF2281287.1 hypothetical protein EI97DRAFT_25396 [Westerdykella ornata]
MCVGLWACEIWRLMRCGVRLKHDRAPPGQLHDPTVRASRAHHPCLDDRFCPGRKGREVDREVENKRYAFKIPIGMLEGLALSLQLFVFAMLPTALSVYLT